MKKIPSFVLVLFILLTVGVGCVSNNFQPAKQSAESRSKNLTIYAYDSLTSEWGLLTKIIKKFESDNKTKTNIVSFSDTGKMINQLIAEKQKNRADIVIGLDNLNFSTAINNDLLQSYQPVNSSAITTSLWFDNKYTMTPFDFGYVGFVYDSKKIDLSKTMSLMELASDKYKKKIIIEQAGLSSPGTQLLLWTKLALSQDDYAKFWNNIKKNVLTVSPDWGTAYYSLFVKGEAPIVLSYLTSPAYHIDQENNDQYRAVSIKEGYVRQVEGVSIVKGTKELELAQKFIDYMLTDDVQNEVAKTQWMFPVLGKEDKLPSAYKKIIIPKAHEILIPSSTVIANEFSIWLSAWNKLFGIK